MPVLVEQLGRHEGAIQEQLFDRTRQRRPMSNPTFRPASWVLLPIYVNILA
jgi:hypothetical protein